MISLISISRLPQYLSITPLAFSRSLYSSFVIINLALELPRVELPPDYNDVGTWPAIRFTGSVFNPMVSPSTGELDLKSVFPEWVPGKHYMVTALTYLKKVFYMKDFSFPRPANPEAQTLFQVTINTVLYFELQRHSFTDSASDNNGLPRIQNMLNAKSTVLCHGRNFEVAGFVYNGVHNGTRVTRAHIKAAKSIHTHTLFGFWLSGGQAEIPWKSGRMRARKPRNRIRKRGRIQPALHRA